MDSLSRSESGTTIGGCSSTCSRETVLSFAFFAFFLFDFFLFDFFVDNSFWLDASDEFACKFALRSDMAIKGRLLDLGAEAEGSSDG